MNVWTNARETARVPTGRMRTDARVCAGRLLGQGDPLAHGRWCCECNAEELAGNARGLETGRLCCWNVVSVYISVYLGGFSGMMRVVW